jgi:hypothetical protein
MLRFLSILLLAALLSTCKESKPSSGETNETPTKSVKRGISYNIQHEEDLIALRTGLSWWYNWGTETSISSNYYDLYKMEYIPMLWSVGNATTYDNLKSFIIKHPEINYLLVLNEPNLKDQANMYPATAAKEWLKYEQVVKDLANLGRTVYIVGPAITWGTLDGYSDPIVWMDAFYEEYRKANNNRDPQIDYLAFHWYDYGLESQLNRLEKYGKEIWITEMANWNSNINSYEKQAEQMKEMVALCERREDVFRYAWFIGRGAENRFTNLFDSQPGKLNSLGELYISLPF